MTGVTSGVLSIDGYVGGASTILQDQVIHTMELLFPLSLLNLVAHGLAQTLSTRISHT